MSQISKLTNQKLIESMPFTEKDLSLNRQMKLSQKQKVKIKPTMEFYTLLSIFCTTLSFVISTIALMKGFASLGLFCSAFLSVLSFGLGIYWTFRNIQKLKQVKNYKGVSFIEGNAEFKISYKFGFFQNGEVFTMPSYLMKIDGFKFYFDENTYDLIQGNVFRVYYYRNIGKVFLSIENID